jgi:ABC-type Fe3+-citrate transport system substrate-binding protein
MKKNTIKVLSALFLSLFLVAACGKNEDKEKDKKKEGDKKEENKGGAEDTAK